MIQIKTYELKEALASDAAGALEVNNPVRIDAIFRRYQSTNQSIEFIVMKGSIQIIEDHLGP